MTMIVNARCGATRPGRYAYFPNMLLAAGLCACIAAPAFASDTQDGMIAHSSNGDATPEKDSITLGILGVMKPDYDGSKHYQFWPAPIGQGSISGFAFDLDGDSLSVDLIRARSGSSWDLQAGPYIALNFDRAAKSWVHDDRVKALGIRHTAVEAGAFVGIGKTGVLISPYDYLTVSVSYRHDVGSVHKSYIWEPTFTYTAPLSNKMMMTLQGSMEIVGRKYARAYYGVSLDQSVASGLQTYDAHGGVKQWTLGVYGTRSLTGDLKHGVKLIAGGTYGGMGGSIRNSPLIRTTGSVNQWSGSLGLAYTF